MTKRNLTILFVLLGGLVLAAGCSQMSHWSKLNRKVTRHFHDGKYLQATEVAHQSLELAERAFGANHLHVATSLGNLVFLYNLQGEYKKARTLLYRALSIKELELGPEHVETGMLLLYLSENYRFAGNYAKAESFGQRALKILTKHLDEADLLMTEGMNNLAFIYDALNKNKKA